ncbi:hypothetical protein H0H81_005730 [Sphagnurus paluster]|uniref:Uncharacterized protein n=1 Tax=Sphagnurus paluster TaxID=117069 RepID=A0A9P7GLJ1_9AGAR|nr:hypothetical protein H0H81_005730 [Sphagnurus paluster]
MRLFSNSMIHSFAAPLSPKMKKYLAIQAVTKRSEPQTNRPTATQEAKNLSSSTSATPSTRGRTESSRPLRHARSASSSAFSTTDQSAATEKAPVTTAPIRQKPIKTEMAPPPYVPTRPAQPSRDVSASRLTSAMEPRPRVVSTSHHTRPVISSRPVCGLHTRPASANSYRQSSQRPQMLVVRSQEPPSGPRRVPITEPPQAQTLEPKKQSADVSSARTNSATTRAASSDARTSTVSVVPAREKAKAVLPLPSTVASAYCSNISDTAPERIARSRGVTQPTLAQLSRAKATAERKPPTANTARKVPTNGAPKKQPSKPTVGGSSKPSNQPPVSTVPKQVWGARAKSGSSSTATTQKVTSKCGSRSVVVATKSIAAAQIPLPPSPTVSAVDALSDDVGVDSLPPSQVPLVPTIALVTSPADGPSATGEKGPQEVTILAKNDVTIHTSESRPINDKDQEAVSDNNVATVDELGLSTPETVTARPIPETAEFPRTPRVLSSNELSESPSKTPISSLLSSIQRGFLFTPSSPLSPPQSYVTRDPGTQDIPIPFCLNKDGSNNLAPVKKTFMFGVGEDFGTVTSGNM